MKRKFGELQSFMRTTQFPLHCLEDWDMVYVPQGLAKMDYFTPLHLVLVSKFFPLLGMLPLSFHPASICETLLRFISRSLFHHFQLSVPSSTSGCDLFLLWSHASVLMLMADPGLGCIGIVISKTAAHACHSAWWRACALQRSHKVNQKHSPVSFRPTVLYLCFFQKVNPLFGLHNFSY